MKGLVGEEEDFVHDMGLDWEPMEMDENRGDVLPGLGASENPGSRVLDILEPVQGFAGNPKQDPIAVVEVGGDEGVD